MKAVIVAGGKGTRLAEISKDVPKALIKIGNKPVIEHQILLLKKYGIKNIWLLLGHLSEPIRRFLGDGKKWGVKINYHQEQKLLGRTGALKTIENEIKEDFLFLSGDVMADFDINRFIAWHKQKKNKIASIIVHPSDHPFDSDLIEIDNANKITSLFKKPHNPNRIFQNLGIASIFIFSSRIFKYIPSGRKTDFEKDILPKVLKAGEKVYAYNTPEYIKDMGTPKRLKQVKADYVSGKIKKMNLQNKRKAVFLDRDGVLNKQVGQISRLEDLRIYNFAAKAVKNINNSGYLAILVTNQPQIAKGFVTEETINLIHKKLETELAKVGAKLDAIYYCPHHPEKSFEGERAELKISCQCRKPAIGLFLRAKNDFNIDIKKSYMIGDQTMDILAGKRAGCKTILAQTGYAGKDKKYQVKPDFTAHNLAQALKTIESKTI